MFLITAFNLNYSFHILQLLLPILCPFLKRLYFGCNVTFLSLRQRQSILHFHGVQLVNCWQISNNYWFANSLNRRPLLLVHIRSFIPPIVKFFHITSFSLDWGDSRIRPGAFRLGGKWSNWTWCCQIKMSGDCFLILWAFIRWTRFEDRL